MSTQGQRRLGRGLDALLAPPKREQVPNAVAPAVPAAVPGPFREVPVAFVSPNPHQPRKEFVDGELAELKASIQANGLLQPILVRPIGDRFEIVAGERRFRAIRELGWERIPAHVRELSEREVLTLALIENLQRQDLNAIEEAEGYQELISRHALTQQQVADAVGRDRSSVANALRLLGLPDVVRAHVRDGKLSAGHARALLGITNPRDLVAFAEVVVRDGLPVRAVERHVRAAGKPASKTARAATRAPSRPPELSAIETRLRRRFQTDAVITLSGPARGEIRLSFYSADDLERLLDLLRVADASEV